LLLPEDGAERNIFGSATLVENIKLFAGYFLEGRYYWIKLLASFSLTQSEESLVEGLRERGNTVQELWRIAQQVKQVFHPA